MVPNVINRSKWLIFDLPAEMDPALRRELPGRGINPPLIKIGLNTRASPITTITTMLRLPKKVLVIVLLQLNVQKIQTGIATIVPIIQGKRHIL